jgi:hypothetical protein
MYQKAQSALQARPLDVVRNLFSSQPLAPPPAQVPEIETLRLRVQELEDRLRAEERKAAAKRKPARKRAAKQIQPRQI